MKNPIEITCSNFSCGATPGLPCKWGDTAEEHPEFHFERQEAAEFIDSLENRSAHPGEEMPITDRVIDETGLF